MSKQKLMSILFAIAISVCLGSTAFGQEITGSIVGSVRDSNSAAVPGATVTVSDPSKSDLVVRTVTTNDDGTFSVPNVQISTYTITVEMYEMSRSGG